jgi:hypothetical protein
MRLGAIALPFASRVPSALSPWQLAQFCSNSCRPLAWACAAALESAASARSERGEKPAYTTPMAARATSTTA